MKHPTAQERRAKLEVYADLIAYFIDIGWAASATIIRAQRDRYRCTTRASVKKTTKGTR